MIYVGKLAEGTTRADLRHRFEPFGPVVDISLHFRERGYWIDINIYKYIENVRIWLDFDRDNYGFVTFAYKVDAYEAVEHGNDDPHLPKYDLSFGGRRSFCKETYADLGDYFVPNIFYCLVIWGEKKLTLWWEFRRCCGRRRAFEGQRCRFRNAFKGRPGPASPPSLLLTLGI